MAQGEIREIIKNAIHIKNNLDKGISLDGWMYSYVTTSNDHLNSVAEQIDNPNIDEQAPTQGAETLQQKQVRAAITKGIEVKSQYGKDEYQSQPTKRNWFDPKGFSSDQLTGVDSIDPDGTVVISLGDTSAEGMVKKLAALGGMPGVKTRQIQTKVMGQGVAEGLIDYAQRKLGLKWGKIGDVVNGSVVAEYLDSQDDSMDTDRYINSKFKLINITANEAEKYREISDLNGWPSDTPLEKVKGWGIDNYKMDRIRKNDVTYQSLMKHTPVVSHRGFIINGNHRVARALEMGIDPIPILKELQQGVAEGWKDVVAGGAMALGALGAGAAGAQTMPNINAQQVELANKYYNVLVQRAKEDRKELDTRTLNLLKAKAQDAAAKKTQQSTQQQGFPSQGSERKVSKDAGQFESQGVDEAWSQKYKNSINCSHPKGFSQKAHCAGKKKHNESIEMEMVCEDCGMCETHCDHENLDEACWKGYHKEGNKKMFGKTYPNCVQNESKEQEKCPHCNGPMFSEALMNEKKDACYYKVKSRYKVWPSAYASGALVKCRKKGASNWGTGSKNESSILEGIEKVDESLHDWFNKEKWVRMDTKGNIKGPCAKEPGEGKPKCLPQSKAHSLGKKGRASAAARKRREDPNPERSGKAINVATKKKTKG